MSVLEIGLAALVISMWGDDRHLEHDGFGEEVEEAMRRST